MWSDGLVGEHRLTCGHQLRAFILVMLFNHIYITSRALIQSIPAKVIRISNVLVWKWILLGSEASSLKRNLAANRDSPEKQLW
eukprot:Em0031g28a